MAAATDFIQLRSGDHAHARKGLPSARMEADDFCSGLIASLNRPTRPRSAAGSIDDVTTLEHHQRTRPEVPPVFAVRELSRGNDESLLIRGLFFVEVSLPVLVSEADLAERCLAVRPAEAVVATDIVVAVESLPVGEEQIQFAGSVQILEKSLDAGVVVVVDFVAGHPGEQHAHRQFGICGAIDGKCASVAAIQLIH